MIWIYFLEYIPSECGGICIHGRSEENGGPLIMQFHVPSRPHNNGRYLVAYWAFSSWSPCARSWAATVCCLTSCSSLSNTATRSSRSFSDCSTSFWLICSVANCCCKLLLSARNQQIFLILLVHGTLGLNLGVDVSLIKELPCYLLGRTEENHENLSPWPSQDSSQAPPTHKCRV